VPKSAYDLLKDELEIEMNELNELKQRFDAKKGVKLDELFNKTKLIRQQIHAKTDEVFQLIARKRDSLLGQVKYIEEYLIKSLNELRADPHMQTRNAKAKELLTLNEYNESQLHLLKTEFNNKKIDLNFKFNLADKIDQFEFVSTETADNIIGELKNVKWVSLFCILFCFRLFYFILFYSAKELRT
jgi:DNA polymerase III delta prime subunit